jgi:hypothetical protein
MALDRIFPREDFALINTSLQRGVRCDAESKNRFNGFWQKSE